ncbi:MFS transporter [Cellulomonas endophytica]|uniref:MFS transporter n=1 Tax=Cellulomonas endophytica TaxID=2494735 RepID=UPI001F0C343A|nr:MFS transporter [Cellulomonas endophytica]
MPLHERLSPFRVRVALVALALGGFSIGTTEFATMGLLPEIATDLDLTIPGVGHAITAYALGVVVGAPTITALAARVDRRRLLLLLMVAFVVGNVGSAFATDGTTLVAARFVAGLPHGAFFGVGAVLGTAVVGRARRGQAVAAMMTGLTLACAAGVPLAAVVGTAVGWRWSFVGVGLLGLATLAALALWAPSLPAAPGATVRGELGALRSRPLWVAVGGGAVGFGGMFAVYSYVKPLLTDVTGLDVGTVPLVLALFGIGMTVGTVLGGRLADRSVLATVLSGMVATAAVLVVLALVATRPVPAVAALVALGVVTQVLGLALQTRLMDLAPAAPSLGAALCHSALNVGNAGGAWAGGLVIAAGLGYVAPAWVGAAVTLVGLVVLLVAGRTPAPRVPDGTPAEPLPPRGQAAVAGPPAAAEPVPAGRARG